MSKIKNPLLLGVAIIFTTTVCGQQSEYYSRARDAYERAAANSCPDRARVLREYAAWCQCMVDLLAGKRSSCGAQPTTPVPSCDGNSTTTAPTLNTNVQSSDDLANSVASLISGISELAKMKLDDNSKSDSWYILSGGVNLDGNAGPLAGTTADIGHLAGYFFDASGLSRKGISILGSFTSLKSRYFHSFRAKGTDGQYRQYIGTTEIEMPVLGFSLGKDLTGPMGSFHFVPNIGADLIFGIQNDFVSKNFQGVEYEEEWTKDMFFTVHAGIQMFYLFSKRFGLQGGLKYLYFPSESGTVFKTNGFFHMNTGVAIRIN